MITKTCQQCNKPFLQYPRIDGRPVNLSRRSYCLDCSPFGERKMNRKPTIDGQRECFGCHTFKPISDFQVGSRLRSYCPCCENKRILAYGRQLKQKAVEYLGGQCCLCGYYKSMRSLTFHHKNPSQKDFSIGKHKNLKWETIRKELDKCMLLCANCHGEIHEEANHT